MAKSVSNRGEATLTPADFGGEVTEAELTSGETVQKGSDIFIKILENKGTLTQHRGLEKKSGTDGRCRREKVRLAKYNLDTFGVRIL
ncbi:MAG: hypothetical protein K9J37_20420 [Saprospiraceae bacterium]|nr:hypothetical protein [Saprospiraceae bacterium]MCF8252291.1 hypothetical protein [Saprospiraceae bacterium]MCF8282088.1 hypothetical protein [Bacteroidales bacterium]MCF8313932.1 hypothetical protein [Saprospiraceae bacterium]MCF8442643.1 hypothetical protein [Saprospiraceae bacterium]